MAEMNLEDSDILPAPKLIEVIFQNCKGQVDQWVEPYIRITLDRLRRTENRFLKCLLIQVVANALYYNCSLTLGILHKLGVATEFFNLWFQMLQEVKKSGVRPNFKREHDKKVCCLGLTSLIALPEELLPSEAFGRVFNATLELLAAYKDQIAESQKEEEEEKEEDDNMNGFQSDDEDEDDREMGDDDDEEDRQLQKLAAQAKEFHPNEEYDSDDYSDEDEMMQTPIDEVDPFIFFVETSKVLQASNPPRMQNLMQTLDFNHQALAVGIAQHAEVRKVEMEKEKLGKVNAS